MDTNPHNQPFSSDYPDSPHQGVVIEDYRGPLLSQQQTRSGVSASRTPAYPAPLFADGPLPEWLAEQPQPRQPTRLRRWLTRTFRSDDEVLNWAKRGFGWMLLSLLGLLLLGFDFSPLSGADTVVTRSLVGLSCLSPLGPIFFLPAALVDHVRSLLNFRASRRPGLVGILSLVALCIEAVMLLAALYILFWFSQEWAVGMSLSMKAQICTQRYITVCAQSQFYDGH